MPKPPNYRAAVKEGRTTDGFQMVHIKVNTASQEALAYLTMAREIREESHGKS